MKTEKNLSCEGTLRRQQMVIIQQETMDLSPRLFP